MFFSKFCDSAAITNVPISPYVNEHQARVANARAKPGASVKQLLHYAENIKSGEFRQFDYFSAADNYQKYGSSTAPAIDVSKISQTKVPIGMFVGDQDSLSEFSDTKYLADLLGPQTVVEYMYLRGFDHSSFNLYKPT